MMESLATLSSSTTSSARTKLKNLKRFIKMISCFQQEQSPSRTFDHILNIDASSILSTFDQNVFVLKEPPLSPYTLYTTSNSTTTKSTLVKDDNNNNNNDSNEFLVFRYTIPEKACITTTYHGSNTKRKRFPLSGFLTLFDVFTTFALLAHQHDTNVPRPGVSISLSAHFNGESSINEEQQSMTIANDNNNNVIGGIPNTTIDIYVQVTKLGKSIGFASASAVCPQSRTVVCSGDHIKYLGSSNKTTSWGIVLMSAFFECKHKFQDSFRSIWRNDGHNDEDLTSESSTTTTIIKKEVSDEESNNTPSVMDEVLKFSPAHEQGNSNQELTKKENDVKRGQFRVENEHCNLLGFCHGGCQTMMMEQIGNTHASSQQVLHSMSITYLAALLKTKESNLQSHIVQKSSVNTRLNVQLLNPHNVVVSNGSLEYLNSNLISGRKTKTQWQQSAL